ncbi:hypothetical protein Q8F55_000243 [Vanrija albida]|uniref:Uncharacterized protein n=1 Tax=Vanrija albida TaxID=181172 RepID=A0ABR3QCR6_9TREE
MSPTSPHSLATSPQQFNHFAPLSPDAVNNQLDDVGGEMSAILGLVPRTIDSSPASQPKGPLRTYTRVELLKLGRRGVVPSGLGPLESWFGTLQPSGGPRSSHPPGLDDPAIAAIQPSGRGGRTQAAGSFGDGFGFGGGIGGRGLGRGTRNIGLRRQPEGPVDPAIAEQGRSRENFGGQMGKFSVRNPGDRGMRLGGDEGREQGREQGGERRDDQRRQRRDDGGDWRRGERPNGEASSRRGPPGFGGRFDDDAEPAWMSDGPSSGGAALEDPAIAGASSSGDPSDPLIKFIPGEDMIAAHKRAMKNRGAPGAGGDNWRGAGDKPLVSFFGGAPAPAAPAAPAKPREVNVASYFKHRVFDEDEAPAKKEEQPEPETNAFQSRFQRFFNSGAGGPVPPPQSTSPANVPHPHQSAPQPQPPSSSVRSPPPHDIITSPQQAPPSGPPVDDRMAMLMGMLTTKGPSPAPRPNSTEARPQFHGYNGPAPPGLGPVTPQPLSPHGPPSHPISPQNPQRSPNVEFSGQDYLTARDGHPRDPRHEHQLAEQHGMLPQHYGGPPPGIDPRGYPYPPQQQGPQQGYRPSMRPGELPPSGPRPFFDARGPPGPPPGADPSRGQLPPDLLQLLNQAPRPPMGPGGQPMPPPPMGMLPPHPMQYGPGPPRGAPTPDDLLRSLQSGGPGGPTSPGGGPPPGYLPMPRPPQGGGGPYPPPPNMQGFLPPGPFPFQGGPPRPMPPPGVYNGAPMAPYGQGPPGGGGGGGGNPDMLAALLNGSAPRSH